MAKEKKQRYDKYEEKVSFDGTFEDMVNMSFKKKPESPFTFEEINVGDEVIFYSTDQQSNYDVYWLVTGKDEKSQNIFIKTPNQSVPEAYWTIHISEVRGHLSISRLNK